jgi:hypothetical protein
MEISSGPRLRDPARRIILHPSGLFPPITNLHRPVMPRVRLVAVLFALVLFNGCMGYRLMRPEEIDIPSYEPRPVVIPVECETLIGRVAAQGMAAVTEPESRMVLFCQQQYIIRAQEEEAALKRMEAHANAANFALRVATVVIGATIAILTWFF